MDHTQVLGIQPTLVVIGQTKFCRKITHREKGRDLTQSYYKSPYTSRNVKKGKVTTQTTSQKHSITQRLRTDLGRSVGVTTAS